MAFVSSSLSQGTPGPRRVMLIGWSAPPQGWCKLNTDGACKGNPGIADCGGVLRDHHGTWIKGFTYNMGVCTAFIAELWAVYRGLRMAWDTGCTRVMLKIDSQAVCQVLLGGNLHVLAAANLLFNCKELLSRNWDVSVIHAYREANRVADCLANLSLQQGYGLQTLEVAPHDFQDLVIDDILGVSFPRAIYV